MLSLLHIENIAVVEQADISFSAGFNILSGETGAGKSIIIDAISAIIGMRTYREIIRTGAQKAYVRAVFSDVPELHLPEYFAVPQTSEMYIEREIYSDGRNVCRINGQNVTVSVLKTVGEQLVSIHGQHDSQILFDEQNHIKLLDAFAEDNDVLEEYALQYRRVLEIRAELAQMSTDENEKARRQEMLRFQIQELESAELQPGEDEELETRQKVLSNSERLVSGLDEAQAILSGSEEESGIYDLLFQAKRTLDGITRYDDKISAFSEQLQQLIFSEQDLSEQLRDYRAGFAFSEDELERIEDRLDLIRKLRRKYGTTCEDMLSYLETAKSELDKIIFADDIRIKLQNELSSAEKTAFETASKLRGIRTKAAALLSERIEAELHDLNIPHARFVCGFSDSGLSANGIDSVCFLMSANAGETEKPLNKVASGGELARIMLALKNVLARNDTIGTMIFDEVDTGVSGRAAQKVAEKLLSVSEGKQVLCVTHLPQIAALAQNHLLISKAERNGRTYTSVETLSDEGRTQEIARMIGGTEITDITLRSAREMLRFKEGD